MIEFVNATTEAIGTLFGQTRDLSEEAVNLRKLLYQITDTQKTQEERIKELEIETKLLKVEIEYLSSFQNK